MKPHLPVSLFRALIVAVVSFPVFAFGGEADIPADYTRIDVADENDVAGAQEKAAFVFSKQTVTWNPAKPLFSNIEQSILFTSANSATPTSVNMSASDGRLIGVGDMTFVDLKNIDINANNNSLSSTQHAVAMGGTLAAGGIELTATGVFNDYTNHDNYLTFTKNQNISLENNTLSVNVTANESTPVIRHGYGMGAAAGGVYLNITGNKDINIASNATTVEVSGGTGSSATGMGGAIFGNNVDISNNEDVVIQNNRLSVISADKAVTLGGAVGATNQITIAGNTSVVFRNNAIYKKYRDNGIEKELYYLQGLGIKSDNKGLLSVSAGDSASVTFYDPISVDCDVSLNANYKNTGGVEESAVGNIIFSGKYVEEHLTNFRKELLGAEGATPSAEELELSYTSEAKGTTTLHHGNMTISDKAIYKTGAFIAADNGSSTLILKKGTLVSSVYEEVQNNRGNGSVTFGKGTRLHLQSIGNTIQASNVVFSGSNAITFNLSATNISETGLHIESDSVSFSAGTVIYLNSDIKLTDGVYKLITLGENVTPKGWSSSNISVSGSSGLGFTPTYANLRWKEENGQNVLFYHTSLDILTEATWTNGDGDFLWNSNSINWEQDSQPYAFSNGASATFTDMGAGTVIIAGDIRPTSVLVENTAAGNYEWVAAQNGGQLAGEMSLTKRGTGALKISLANTYTGGTIVAEGSLIAGHEEAFGSGDITVDGGHLNTNTYAVKNNVLVNSGEFSGTAFAGKLTIAGTAILGDNTTAGSVDIQSGSVSGGSLTNTNITSKNATITTLLSGTTNLTVTGNTTLMGDHTSTGKIVVEGGVLTLDGTSTTNYELQGGSLRPTTPLVLNANQKLAFKGGSIQGELQTSAGSQVSILETSTISGNLTLNGGTITPSGSGVVLKVGTSLNILGATTIDVNAYINKGEYPLISANSHTGSIELLTAITDTRNLNKLDIKNNTLILTVKENPATLYWKANAEGIWKTLDPQEWDTDAADNRFYDRDAVVFDAGGIIDIQGEVKPSSVLAEGTENVTLTGTGSISGSAALVKKGCSTLTLNPKNTYTGGTSIEEGIVKAGGDESFGSGKIQLNELGTLNLGDYAVANDISAYGGQLLAATAYKGKLSVAGNLKVDDKTTAEKIVLSSGSIEGGSIVDTPISSTGSARIMSNLKGTSSITVAGTQDSELILSGRNTFTGDITIQTGTLLMERREAMGSGNIYLNGGSLKATEGVTLVLSGKQELHFRGGLFSGNLRTANDTSLVIDSDATLNGNLTLNGGALYFNGKAATGKPETRSMIMTSNGCTLSVSGTLNLTAGTMVALEEGQYADGDILIEAKSLTGDFGQLILDYDDGNPNTEYTLTLAETDGKMQVMLDLDKVYEHTNGKWTISNGELRDLLVQSNWGMYASSHAFADALQGQRSASGVVGSKGVMAWASGLYSHQTIDDDGIKGGADSDTMGAAVGIETMLGSRSCIGLAVGLTSTDVSVNNVADKMEQEGTYFGIYGATVLSSLSEISGLTLSWSAAYGSVESSPSGAASSIKWLQDSFQLNGRLDWSRAISDRTTVNLFAGLEYFMSTSDTVAGIDSGDISNLRAELGAGITRRYSSSVLYAEARLLGDVMRDDPSPTINGWSEEGANPGTVGAGFRIGAAYDVTQFWSVGANGNIEIMGGTLNAGANVGASFKF